MCKTDRKKLYLKKCLPPLLLILILLTLGVGTSSAAAKALTDNSQGVDFWTTGSGVVRVPIESIPNFTPAKLRLLRIRHQGGTIPIHVIHPHSRKPTVLVYAPKMENAHSTAEIHFFADFSKEDPSSAIEEHRVREARHAEKRIIQRYEHRGEDYWASYRPPQEGGGHENLWSAPKTAAGGSVIQVFGGFGSQDEAVKLEAEFWGASAGNHRITAGLNEVVQDEFRCSDFGTCIEAKTLSDLSPSPDGSFQVKWTVTKNTGSPPDAVNYVRSAIYIRSGVDLSGPFKSFISYENRPIDLILPLTDKKKILIWDVTDPLNPQWISLKRRGRTLVLPGFSPGRHYILFDPTQPLQPAGVEAMGPPDKTLTEEGDLLVICPPVFHSALQPLLVQRQKEGWTPVVRTPREIYIALNHGQPSPEAIKKYLRYAVWNWRGKKLKAVLLIGDASPRIYQASEPDGSPSVPTNFIWDRRSGFWVPSDIAYVLFLYQDAGKKTEMIPAIGIGRISARMVEELTSAVARTLRYGAVRSNEFLYLSDDNDDGIYKGIAEEIKTKLPARFASSALHLVDFNERYPNSSPPPAIQYDEPAAGAFRHELNQALQGGRRVVMYFGHGDMSHIAGEGLVAQATNYNNLEVVLDNGYFPPILMAFNCLSGYFAHYDLKHSIAESIMLMAKQEKGFAATITPAAYTEPMHMLQLATHLQNAITGEQVGTIGEALTRSIGDLLLPALNGGDPDAADSGLCSYNLLGDPSLPTPASLQGRGL